MTKRLHWLGHAAAMGAILVSLLIFVGLIWSAAQQVVERFPFPGGGVTRVDIHLPEARTLFRQTEPPQVMMVSVQPESPSASAVGGTAPASASEARAIAVSTAVSRGHWL